MPISLALSAHPLTEPDPSLVLQWSQDDIPLAEPWSTNWIAEYPGYWNWDQWQGVPCDFAWLFEHAYGFPGAVIPQAFQDDDVYSWQHLLFRSGGRYFVFTLGSDPELRSWPLTLTISDFDV